jgi:nitrite reductase/ring-hydroxylating ferredoxin subunit
MTDSDRLDLALERLVANQSPRAAVEHLDDDEREMLRMAQLLRGTQDAAPRPAFVRDLHDRLFPAPKKVTRRTAFVSGLGAMAAGLLAGLGIERAVQGGAPAATTKWKRPLVNADKGKWIQVADVTEVPPGAVRSFSAGAVQGFILNKDGNLRAVSRICTHMGCALDFKQTDQSFVCPCHGAEFDMHGQMRYGPGGYTRALPPLPGIQVRVKSDKIEVFGV